MNVFVSYSRRDGAVTTALLNRLQAYLGEFCVPFIHALEEPRLRHQQLGVIKALLRSHLILILVSPASRKSPWVRLELLLGRLLFRPVVAIEASTLEQWKESA